MNSKISKAQLEVWQWKERAYEEIKHLSTREQLCYIHEQTKALVEKFKRKKEAPKPST